MTPKQPYILWNAIANQNMIYAAYDLLAQGGPLGVCTHRRDLHQTERNSHRILVETMKDHSSFHPAQKVQDWQGVFNMLILAVTGHLYKK